MSAPTEPKWTKAEITPIGVALAKKISEIDRKLTVIKGWSGWHEKQHTTLAKRTAAAKAGIEKLKTLPNKKKGDDGNAVDPDKLTVEVDAILNDVNAAFANKPKVTYYYGPSQVKDQHAIETKAKVKLPVSDEKHASQAVQDAVSSKNPKDASVAGTGVKHASAGIKGVGSCTVFFTWDDLHDGLERRFTVVAVGGHDGPSSYKICETFTSKLKVGQTVSL